DVASACVAWELQVRSLVDDAAGTAATVSAAVILDDGVREPNGALWCRGDAREQNKPRSVAADDRRVDEARGVAVEGTGWPLLEHERAVGDHALARRQHVEPDGRSRLRLVAQEDTTSDRDRYIGAGDCAAPVGGDIAGEGRATHLELRFVLRRFAEG